MNSGGELIFKVRNIHLHDESIDDIVHKYKSCHRRCSMEEGVLKNFVTFTKKDLYWSIFIDKVASLKLANL